MIMSTRMIWFPLAATSRHVFLCCVYQNISVSSPKRIESYHQKLLIEDNKMHTYPLLTFVQYLHYDNKHEVQKRSFI